jgi:hypothetical protein
MNVFAMACVYLWATKSFVYKLPMKESKLCNWMTQCWKLLRLWNNLSYSNSQDYTTNETKVVLSSAHCENKYKSYIWFIFVYHGTYKIGWDLVFVPFSMAPNDVKRFFSLQFCNEYMIPKY